MGHHQVHLSFRCIEEADWDVDLIGSRQWLQEIAGMQRHPSNTEIYGLQAIALNVQGQEDISKLDDFTMNDVVGAPGGGEGSAECRIGYTPSLHKC